MREQSRTTGGTPRRRGGPRKRRGAAGTGAAVAVGAVLVTLVLGGCATGRTTATRAVVSSHTSQSTPAFSAVEQWTTSVSGVIAGSSPIPADIDGKPAVIVGARDGKVYAFNRTNGLALAGWPATVPGSEPVDSTPSLGSGLIFVGTGNAASPFGGGYLALNTNGTEHWYHQVSRLPNGKGGQDSSVSASMAVGYLDNSQTVVAGSLGQYEDAFRTTGQTKSGFPWFSSDTEFSTPAIANIYGNGQNYIIGGAEQTAGEAYGHKYTEGGHLRVLKATGNSGTGTPGGGDVCDFTPNQGVYSSPAVGRFLAGGAVGITVGTSTDVKNASDTDKLYGLGPKCGLVWQANLDGATTDSPALVDALGNHALQVAEGTATTSKTGTVYLLNGSNGKAYWSHAVGGEVIGGITSANLGGGYQDLLVPTTDGLYILDGKTGAEIDELGKGSVGEQNSALVTSDPDGLIGITVAGYDAKGGVITHYDIAGTNGSDANETGAWPMFHHDTHLSGTTLTPVTG